MKRRDEDKPQDEPEERFGEQPIQLKKQAMSPLEKTIETTKRRVRQSARVQEQVQRRVRDLEKVQRRVGDLETMYAALEQMNNNLKNERQMLEDQQAKQLQQLLEKQAEIERLEQELENNRGIEERLEEYQNQVAQQLKRQVDTLRELNVEMDTISDGYMDLLEQDETKKNIYMEYVRQMLDEAKPSAEEEPVIANALKILTELDLPTIRQKVKMLEQSMDDDETTLVQKINNLDLVPATKKLRADKPLPEAPVEASAGRRQRKNNQVVVEWMT